VVAEVEVSEPGAVSLKTAWKRVTGRNHASASTYLIRATPENAASANIVHSDSLLVNPAEVSKVVDADGNPLVVYHGTTKDFDAFSSGTGWFTTDPGEANFWGGVNADGANVMPAYMALKNPRIFAGIRGIWQ
jgi:hypothetical protein